MFSPRFPTDLLEDVILLVERTYRVRADAQHRAIAGLSMGGGQALSIGLAHPDRFAYVLGYSAAVGGQFADMDETLAGLTRAPRAAERFGSCGSGAAGRTFCSRTTRSSSAR